jgi:uncharacterized membrane protein
MSTGSADKGEAMASIIQINKTSHALVILAVPLVLIAVLYAKYYPYYTADDDIYYLWIEGKRIIDGENPYARILEGNMLDNDKYATYFPVFYWLSALTQFAGLRGYSTWIFFWKIIFDAAHAAIGLLIFWILREQNVLLGVFGALFWWFNRWSIVIIRIADIEVVPLFFLLLSMYWFGRRQNASLLLFGLSLGLKQIGIFILPVYLIWVWQRQASLKRVLIALLLISVITLVTAIPFIVWNPAGFVKSIVFSATRHPESYFNALSVDDQFGLVGLPGKIPMMILLLMVYAGVWQQVIRKFTAGLLTMTIFIDFNSVLFYQYFVWATPFFPLVISDYGQKHSSTINVEP